MRRRIDSRLAESISRLHVIEALESRTLFSAITGLTTTNQLITFDSATPGTIASTVVITGLQGGENILGIDYRPADGLLYGLGSTSRVYQINKTTGVATEVGSGPFTPALNGTAFGVDFNPVADRLRVASDADQNLRLDPTDGSVAATDTVLAFAGGDPNTAANPNIIAAAYTNSFAGAGSTTLYDIDATLDILATQAPPNGGTLNTIGALGVNVTSGGIDISGGASGTAFAGFVVGGTSGLYTINLSTGAATLVGAIGGGGTIRDVAAPLPGVLQLSATSYSVSEAGPVATITVNRTGGSSGTVSVHYATSDGTALDGEDYTAASGTLTFTDGQTSKTFEVPITDDSSDEPNQTVHLTLTTPTGGAVIGDNDTANLTITDDDPTSVDITDVTVTEGDSGTTSAVFTITISAVQASPVTVDFTTSDDTAVAGSDYTAIPTTTITFDPGQTSKTVTVDVLGDTTPELDESFTATLSSPNGAAIGTGTATGTILNDDSGAVAVADPNKPSQNMVLVIGTSGDDNIRFERSGGSNNKIEAFLNDVSQGVFNKPRKLIAYGLAGNDVIRVNSKITKSAVLLGEDGTDVLIGGKGRDMLIGGDGIDALFGRGNQDVLIGASTDHDNDLTALSALIDAFNTTRGFGTRAANLQSGNGVTGGFALNPTTVGLDGDIDILTGDDSRQLYFFSTGDVISDQNSNDVIVTIAAS